jgi:uncharacterized protein (DUF58 family)
MIGVGRGRGGTAKATGSDTPAVVEARTSIWFRALFSVVLIIVGLVLARLLGLVELAALSIAASAALALDGTWFLFGLRRRPEATARISFDAVPIGVVARAEIEVVNQQANGSTLPCEIHWYNSTTTEPHGTTTITKGFLGIDSCAPGDSVVVSHDLDNRRRGVTSIAGTTLVTRSPLRVWTDAQPIDPGGKVLVWPRLHPLIVGQSPPSYGLSTEQTQLPILSQPDGDLVGLRPYVRGDDIRMIHWRTSARRNYPHVVQKEPPLSQKGIRIWLDTRIPDPDDPRALADFERALSAAASVIHDFATRNLPVTMSIPGESPDDYHRVEGTPRDLLNHLALARPFTGDASPDRAGPGRVSGRGTGDTGGMNFDLAITSSSFAGPPTQCPTLACWVPGQTSDSAPPVSNFAVSGLAVSGLAVSGLAVSGLVGPTVHWVEGTPLHEAWAQLLTAAIEVGEPALQRQP